LERLKGERSGQHSIRINEQYRICFGWEDGYADAVEVTDYH
jgi:proteic killer suppression protein